MGRLWVIHGSFMGHTWVAHGSHIVLDLVKQCDQWGQPLVTEGPSMAHPWAINEYSMGSRGLSLVAHGPSMSRRWVYNGGPWVIHGVLQVTHGSPIGHMWASLWYVYLTRDAPLGLPWVMAHGSHLGNPWVTH